MQGEEPRPRRIVLDLDWLPEPIPGPHTVAFLPRGPRVEVQHGYSVFEAGQQGGVPIPTTCGGKGTCGRCRVRFSGDRPPPPGPIDKRFIPRAELAMGVRLACRTRVLSDLAVTVLGER